jgi:hypothetical protein
MIKIKKFKNSVLWTNGGEEGIRTPGTLVAYTHFPGVRLRPLGHLSMISKNQFPPNFLSG